VHEQGGGRSRRGRLPRRIALSLLACASALGAVVAPAGALSSTLNMAAKNFPGAQVLSQVYGQALAARGAHVTFADDVGPTEQVFPALQAGTFDAYAEYQGTLLTYLGGEPTPGPQRRTRRSSRSCAAPGSP